MFARVPGARSNAASVAPAAAEALHRTLPRASITEIRAGDVWDGNKNVVEVPRLCVRISKDRSNPEPPSTAVDSEGPTVTAFGPYFWV